MGNHGYDAFISYSHAANDGLAAALQSGLHRLARPWYRLRALHVFRDKTNLELNPHLWTDIKAALDQAGWLILLASPKAAASEWVDREVEYWIGHRRADHILIVLTDGGIEWDDEARCFDERRSNALPKRLVRAFAEEPLYLDLSWARDTTDLSLNHPRFREAIAEIAAALSGRDKDELIGDDVRQHRRTRRIAWTAALSLAALTVAAVAASIIAVQQRNDAETQRARAVEQGELAQARQLAAQSRVILTQSPGQLPLATLLALESTRIASTGEGNEALRAALALLPRIDRSLPYEEPDAGRVRALAFSTDGQRLAIARDDGTVSMLALVGNSPATVLSHEERPGEVVDLPGGGLRWKAPGLDAEVTSVAFAPDGRTLASGDNDKTARLWDVATGRELQRLVHDDSVASVAFDPSGTLLATGSKDGSARVWDTATGRLVFSVAHGEEVRKVAFSPDGRYLAAISTDSSISVVDVRTRKELHRWSVGDAGLGLAFSADSTRLATANGEYAAVWDVRTGKRMFRAQHANLSPATPGLNWIDDVSLSTDGSMLATAGRDSTARVWDVGSGQELLRLQHGAPVSTVAFSRDGTLLSTASVDGAARAWELASGTERLRASQPAGAETVAFSPDGSVIASGASDGTVEIWKLDRGDQVSTLTLADRVDALGIAANGALAASADGFVHVWSPQHAGTPVRVVKLPAPTIDGLTFDETGTNLAASWSDHVFLLDSGRQLAVTKLTDFHWANEVAIGPGFVAAFDREKRALRLWETSTGRELSSIAGDYVDDLGFDTTGTVLAARYTDRSGNGFVATWSLPGERMLVKVPQQHSAWFALAPRGRTLAIRALERKGGDGDATQYLDVHDGATGARISRIRFDGEADASFNPRGDRLFLIQDTELGVFDVTSGRRLFTLGHEEEIRRLRASPEDGVLATVAGGNVHVWNYRTGELLSRLSSAGHVLVVRFSADGRYLFTGSHEHTATLWLWKTDDLRAAACARLSRNLTRSEWAQYLGALPYHQSCQKLPAGDAD